MAGEAIIPPQGGRHKPGRGCNLCLAPRRGDRQGQRRLCRALPGVLGVLARGHPGSDRRAAGIGLPAGSLAGGKCRRFRSRGYVRASERGSARERESSAIVCLNASAHLRIYSPSSASSASFAGCSGHLSACICGSRAVSYLVVRSSNRRWWAEPTLPRTPLRGPLLRPSFVLCPLPSVPCSPASLHEASCPGSSRVPRRSRLWGRRLPAFQYRRTEVPPANSRYRR